MGMDERRDNRRMELLRLTLASYWDADIDSIITKVKTLDFELFPEYDVTIDDL